MNSPKKFPVGALLYWVSLVSCALLMITGRFSFAGGGVSGVYTTTPCFITNTECPLCESFTSGDTYLATQNMADIVLFSYPESGVGRYQLDEVVDVACFYSALCVEDWTDMNLDCSDSGCVSASWPSGCRTFVRSDWVTVKASYEKWKKTIEE